MTPKLSSSRHIVNNLPRRDQQKKNTVCNKKRATPIAFFDYEVHHVRVRAVRPNGPQN
jgi:hypothetical protein